MNCPCDSGQSFKACCEAFLTGDKTPDSPEQLMRSRYVAYAQKNLDYIEDTTDPQAMGDFDRASAKEWMETAEFTKLEILSATNEGNKGVVEFKAHFQIQGGEAEIHHEISKFRKQAGTWYFRDGRQVPPPPEKA